jgi:hypothetical protein
VLTVEDELHIAAAVERVLLTEGFAMVRVPKTPSMSCDLPVLENS